MSDRQDVSSGTEPTRSGPHGAPELEVIGLSKTFRWQKKGVPQELLAIDSLDLTISKGEFVTVIGPSGSGKTTLLRIVAGLLPFDGGEVRINGAPVTGPGQDRAVVFQSFGLFPYIWRKNSLRWSDCKMVDTSLPALTTACRFHCGMTPA